MTINKPGSKHRHWNFESYYSYCYTGVVGGEGRYSVTSHYSRFEAGPALVDLENEYTVKPLG